jgi:hypothetical protein
MIASRRALPVAGTPEFALAVACAIWPPSARRVAAVRAACAGELDWPGFVETIKRHRIVGLADHALREAGIDVPAAEARAIAAVARQIARRTVRFAASALRLRAAFDAAGIPVAFIKGLPLAIQAYGQLGLRHAKDIDILVPPDQVEAASLLLDRAGYERRRPPAEVTARQYRRWCRLAKETEWQHEATRLHLELHWRLTDFPSLLSVPPPRSAYREIAIAEGMSLPSFDRRYLVIYLCAHGASHAWSRLKWLADVAALLAGSGEAEIAELYEAGHREGAGRAVGQALILCRLLFDLALPPTLSQELERDPVLRLSIRVALLAMTRGGGRIELSDLAFGKTLVSLSGLLLVEGWRPRLAELRRLSVNFDDMIQVPLPEPLHFLYPLLRLPLWAWRRGALWNR